MLLHFYVVLNIIFCIYSTVSKNQGDMQLGFGTLILKLPCTKLIQIGQQETTLWLLH